MPVIYKKSSPYQATLQKNNLVNYLDFITFVDIPNDDTDVIITVESKFHQRPDLLSYDLYGTVDLWWVFIIRNPDQMIDPIYDLVADLDLYAPDKQRVFDILGV